MKVGDTVNYNAPVADPKGTYECKVLASHGQWLWLRPLRWRTFASGKPEWKAATKNDPVTVLRKDVVPQTES